MSTSAHDTGVYNVEATLFAWMTEGITTYAPPLITPVEVTDRAPEQSLVAPVWSVQFLDAAADDAAYLGRVVDGGLRGRRFTGRMHVNAVVTRRDPNWRAQLNQMLDAVRKAVYAQPDAAVIIRDFYTNAVAPTTTGYRIMLAGVESAPQPGTVNPDIEQRGVFIVYHWIERV